MSQNLPESLSEMLAAWNEADDSKVHSHLVLALDPSVRFTDPNYDIAGIDAFEKMVHEVHARIPGAIYSHQNTFDCHHNLYRYHWSVHHQGKLIVPGFDVVEISPAGLVTQVLGFFGPYDRDDLA